MSSDDTLSIPVDLIEGAIGEAELSQPNTVQEQIKSENAEGGSRKKNILIESLKQELGIINNPATNVNHRTMLRVPEHIKQLNPDAYKPRLISIGPVHHGRPELRPMEALKRRYAQNFIQRDSLDIEALIEITEKYEETLRNNYGITSSEIPSDEFVKLMCIDATFLVEFLSRELYPGCYSGKWNNVRSDLFLLENQIPLYYLREVLALSPHEMEPLRLWDDFIDDIGLFYLGVAITDSFNGEKHLLDRLRTRMAFITNEKRESAATSNPVPTISQLHRAGITFQPNKGWSPELIFGQGILEIPPFAIDHNTPRYFANLVASELFANDHYASHYIELLDCFIDGPEDVGILAKNGILLNYLEDDKAVASLMNEIGRTIDVGYDFRYTALVEDLKGHCRKFWIQWKSVYLFEWKRDLKANYFGNPWKTLSVIAAVILLGLTVIQTVCSLLQL